MCPICKSVRRLILLALALLLSTDVVAQELTYRDGRTALLKAVRFMKENVSAGGGYLWQYSADLKLREGEGRATATEVWVQPPGTPSMGEALLESYLLTGEKELLETARAAAHALADGQLVSGGWDYRIEFDPRKRARYAFRVDASERSASAKNARNVTTLDDDTTQSALRFLMKFDSVVDQKDEKVSKCIRYALSSLLKAQYPNGAWPQRYSEFPDPTKFPVKRASYPKTWSRTYPKKDYRSYYTFNDNTLADMIDTMFLAAEIYGDRTCDAAARRGGEFILLAQMPDPQPAWAQQYNHDMHPAWARRFEPASITGGESQGVLRILMTLFRRTGDRKFLEPIPRALDYLEGSQLPGGGLARFYEFKTNRPLYFTKQYELTYDDSDLPTHYGFKVGFRLKSFRDEYEKLSRSKVTPGSLWTTARRKPSASRSLAQAAENVIKAMDDRGAWVEDGTLRARGHERNTKRVITTRTFMSNLRTLSRFVAATKP